MLKKIMVASAMLSLFACSSIDDGFVYGSSSSQDNPSSSSSISSSSSEPQSSSSSEPESSSSSEPEPSSSSKGPEEVIIANLGSQGGLSALFKTYPYGFTLRASENEDLTPFWNCPPEEDDAITVAQANDCMASDRTDAILQNSLTTKDSPLHYIVNNKTTSNATQRAIKLESYKLTGTGDQAALGLDVSEDGLKALDGVVAFTYYYNGGAHKFRIAVDDADYWEADIPATTEETLVTIKVSDFEKPLDISKATKFLWVVEFDEDKSENNTGSLLIYLLKALIEKED